MAWDAELIQITTRAKSALSARGEMGDITEDGEAVRIYKHIDIYIYIHTHTHIYIERDTDHYAGKVRARRERRNGRHHGGRRGGT